MLLQSASGITKCDSYYTVRRNKASQIAGSGGYPKRFHEHWGSLKIISNKDHKITL